MFIRVINSKNHKYIKVVENYREDGKVKQKVIANLGKLEDISEREAENIASKLLLLTKSKKAVDKEKSTPSIEELDRYNYGYVVYKRLWDRFKLDEILDKLVEDKEIEYDFKSVVFSMVIDRLLKPKSKLALVENKEDYFYINDELQLNHIYRSLDILSENKLNIEEALFNRNKTLFNISTDIVFYDVTTFYYESKNENDLKKFGYSKDGKFGDVQVVMGLMIDKNGLPIGYELFSGNTFDSKTMVKVLDNLKKKFNIDKVIIVADRGLNSKINLKLIKRVLKSTFNTRPIYHYKEHRIEAHFIVCFIAFMLERDLEIRLKKSKSFREYTITPNRIRDALNSLELSKIKVDNKILFMKSNHSNTQDKLKFAKNIMRFLHIKQLKNLSTKEDILCLF